MMIKNYLFIIALLFSGILFSQSIQTVNYNVSGGTTTSFDNPGTILYPTGYSDYSNKTPIIFVHGITGKLSGSYDANIDQVKSRHLKAAFVQLKPLGSTIENGKLLSKMINEVRWHFNSETVSIVAHSKGGLDTERALYGQNAYTSSNLPTFSYEKVDGVYTFSSPVRGARVADVGSTLSWFSGIVWATMWYTNGWSLTSGNVNGFHNWAKGWRINSTSTFKNAYHPNGASYSRINMSEDNTTRWWAHQSNDECYTTALGSNAIEWAFCYIGRPFQHSVGAYIDAYWEWDWFDSGWRNWHSNSDGFISEYRAKRYANTNASPSLTPGAGDSNYRTMQDANHTSLWERNQNHFSREVASYLHTGLYSNSYYGRPNNNTENTVRNQSKNEVKVNNNSILMSNGNLYFAKNNQTNFIVEEDNQLINFIIYGENKLESIELINKETGKSYLIDTENNTEDLFSKAMASVANTKELPKGNYILKTDNKDFLAVANYEEPSTAFGVNLNFDEEKGYNGESIKIGIANKDNAIDFNSVKVTAYLTQVALDQNTKIEMSKTHTKKITCLPDTKKGFYKVSFEDLTPGSIYSLRIEATAKEGKVLLSRNVINTFYVKQDIEEKTVSVLKNKEKFATPSLNKVIVYPNPTSNFVTISSTKEIQKVQLLDKNGHHIKTLSVNDTKLNINLKELNLPKGFYMIKVETLNDSTIKKLVIK